MSNPKPKLSQLPPPDVELILDQNEEGRHYVVLNFKKSPIDIKYISYVYTKNYASEQGAANAAKNWCDKHNFTWRFK